MQASDLYNLAREGKIQGFSQKPIFVETVISRVFIFEAESLVLKIYKRDNEWWNKDMNDLSEGASRINFITQDFRFNHYLNPEVYKELKTLTEENGVAVLKDPKGQDDELVIVMQKVDISNTMTKNLFSGKLTLQDYERIGKDFATKKMSLPKEFLPNIQDSWYLQMLKRFDNLTSWVNSEKDFSPELADKALNVLKEKLETLKESFSAMKADDLHVLIDCNPENLLFSEGKLSYVDAYPPKDNWRIGAFEVDIFRTGSDIYGLGGKEAYEAYLKGVYSVAENMINKELNDFYLLYGAMIDGPYFYMLAKKDSSYFEKAEKYKMFIETLVDTF